MKKTIQLLGALLLVQVLLAGALNLRGDILAGEVADKPLLAVEADKVDRIAIESADAGAVELRKADGKWQLAGAELDAAKVNAFLDKLKNAKFGTPVATGPDAPERFKVAETKYERRVTIEGAGKPLAVIYFGRPLGTRQIHVRRADQKEVYAVSLNIFDVPVNAQGWMSLSASGKPA